MSPVSFQLFLLFSMCTSSIWAIPCPFNEECTCEADPHDKLVFTRVICDTYRGSPVPQFTAPPNITYRINGLMLISGCDFDILKDNQFSVFSYIQDLAMAQNPGSKPVRQKWSETAFKNVTISKIYIEGVGDTIPLPAALRGMKDLTKLTVKNQGVPYNLDDGAFSNHPKLTSLELSGSPILKVSEKAFSGLNSLAYLWMYSSNVTEFPRAVSDLKQSLDFLHLDGNRIRAVKRGDLAGFSKLSALILRWNPLSQIEPGAFKGSNNLEEIYLDGSTIDNLDLASFAGISPKAKVIYQHAGTLTKLTVSSLNDFPGDAQIDLTYSALQTIDPKIGDLLERYPNATIDIGSSVNLQCQKLQWMYRPVLCTKNMKIGLARCKDIDIWVQDFLKLIAPANPCDPWSPTKSPFSGSKSIKGDHITMIPVLVTLVAAIGRSFVV